MLNMKEPVDPVVAVLRLARALGWSKDLCVTVNEISLTRRARTVLFQINEDGSANEDGTIDVSIEGGNTFVAMDPITIALVLI